MSFTRIFRRKLHNQSYFRDSKSVSILLSLGVALYGISGVEVHYGQVIVVLSPIDNNGGGTKIACLSKYPAGNANLCTL